MKKLVLLRDFEHKAVTLSKRKPLSLERENRKNLLHSAEEQRRFEASEQLLIKFLETEFSLKNAEIYGKVSEKPYLLGQNLSFSKSYCDETLCLAAESGSKIGVDAETLKQPDYAVADVFFTEKEKAYINDSENKALSFYVIWTRKESYMKCVGEGMHFRFDLLDVTPQKKSNISGKLFPENDCAGGLYLNSYLLGDKVISVCSETNDDFPKFIEK